MSLTKKRWIILIASCFVNLCIGSLYSWSVFATPMIEYLNQINGQSITSLAIVFTLANAVGPITMISGGVVNDRLGPKWVLLIGGLLFGGGMIGAGLSKSVAGLLITYGLGVGLGMGLVYGTTVSNTVKFFPDRRGMVGGLTTAFYGGSSILIPPIANALVQNYHVTTAFRLIGAVALFIVCLSSFIIIPCPRDFMPDGWQPAVKNAQNPTNEYSYKEMLKSPLFLIMITMMTCGAFAGLMIISQASPIAQRMVGFSAAQAATAVSILAMFNTLGRVVAGMVSDRIGVLNTLTISFSCSILASLTLFMCSQNTIMPFYAGIAVTGLCFGAIMGIYPGFTAAQFGARNNSVNYGIMFSGFAVAGVLGPMIMSSIYKSTVKYQPAFVVSAVFAGVGLVMIAAFRAVQKRESSGI